MEETERILEEYELYRAQAEVYRQNLDLLNANILDLMVVKESLDQIKEIGTDNEVLVPIGGGTLVKAKIIDTEKVIVGLGADVSVKKTISDAKGYLENRISWMEKTRNETTERLQYILSKLEEITPKVQQILAQAQERG
jgi:prefoldin alpha subunit